MIFFHLLNISWKNFNYSSIKMSSKKVSNEKKAYNIRKLKENKLFGYGLDQLRLFSIHEWMWTKNKFTHKITNVHPSSTVHHQITGLPCPVWHRPLPQRRHLPQHRRRLQMPLSSRSVRWPVRAERPASQLHQPRVPERRQLHEHLGHVHLRLQVWILSWPTHIL